MIAKLERKSHYIKLIGLLPVFVSMLAIVTLYVLDITFLYEPKHLLGVTNTIFTSIIPLTVAFLAAKTYLRTPSLSVLLMGCGMLGFGVCAGSAGWLRELQGGANFNVTVYNTGALLGSICHFAGAMINCSRQPYQRESDRRKVTLASAYSLILMFAVVFTFATVQHVIPPFFVQGSGPTTIRQMVLGFAIFLYANSALLLISQHLRIKSDFVYWYSLCLMMLALGLFAFYLQRIVGSPIGWVGRTSNYAGTIFALIAILVAAQTGKSGGMSLESLISGFFVDAEANYRSLVETASDAIISFDQQNRIILWNSGAEQIFGYSSAEAVGSQVFGMLIPEEHEDTLEELIENSRNMSSQKTVELEARHKDGGTLPIEISAFRKNAPNGWVSTCIFRDITERKQAEEKIRHKHATLNAINRIVHKALTCDTEEDLGRTCLAVAEEVTQSKFGFVGKIGCDGLLHDIAISDPGWGLCEMHDKTGHRRWPGDFKIHGLYGHVLLEGRSLLTNNPGEHPESIGTPFGHPKLNAFLGVPLIMDGRAIGLIAVGNRGGGYSQTDQDALEALSVTVVEVFARKRVEQALRESEERLRRLGDNLPESAVYQYVHETDGSVKFLYFSEGIEQLNGVSVQEVLRDAGVLHRQIFPEYFDRLVEEEERSAREGSDFDMEVPMRLPTGRVRWMRLHSRPRRMPNGRTLWDGVQIDVTDRKEAEEQLRAREQEFVEMFERAAVGKVWSDPATTRMLRVNKAFADMLGYPIDELCGKTFVEITHPEDRERDLAGYDLVRTGSSDKWQIEKRYVRKDGAIMWANVSGSIIRYQDGRPSRTIAVIQDITKRNRAEETLRTTMERFNNILSKVLYGILLVGEDNRVEFANQYFCDQFGFAECPSDLIGMTAGEVIQRVAPAYADSEVSVARIRQIVSQGNWVSNEEITMKDGRVLLRDFVPITVDGKSSGRMWHHRDITERKRVEMELERMGVLLAEGQKISHVGSFEYIADTRTTVWSEEEYRIYGLDPAGPSPEYDVMLAKSIHPDDAALLHLTFVAAIQSGSIYELEHRIVRPDGSVRWVHDRAHPYFDRDGKLIGYIGATLDITERKRVEEELRKSRDELESRVQERTNELVRTTEELKEKAEIIDFAHDAIIVRNSESRIVLWSKGAQETYSFTREEALGQVCHHLLKTTFPTAVESIERLVLEKGEWKGELRQTMANGERIVVDSRWAAQIGKNGKLAGFLEVNRDVTPRKIAEEEFRKADRAFRTLSECNQAMVRQTDEMELLRQVCRIVADVGGYRLVWVGFAENDEAKRVVPIASAGQDHGYLAQAGITWADNERGRGPCGTSIRTGKMAVSQNIQSNPAFAPWRHEAAKRGIASTISLPLIVEGNVIGALGIYASEPDAFDEAESNLLKDLAQNLAYGITSIRLAQRRRRSEEELRAYASRLELINQELQDFAFVAAHDLQEPLRKVQTFCDMAIKRSTGLDSIGQEYLNRAVNSADRMRELLRDLLKFSRVAARPEPFEKVDLAKILREAVDVFETSVREMDCRIDVEDFPDIEADAGQMLLLFENLLDNAIKFRDDRVPDLKIIGRLVGEGICEIVIMDNGIGFEQQYADLIFKPFQRLHPRSEYEGTGMGLTICRKIVERHGGLIRAESEPGKGSKFIIHLPVKQTALEDIIAKQIL